jgi:hypothetical protein
MDGKAGLFEVHIRKAQVSDGDKSAAWIPGSVNKIV